MDGDPFARGSFSDVFKGRYGERNVAIKRFWVSTNDTGKVKIYKVSQS
jgi:hypothetical protein